MQSAVLDPRPCRTRRRSRPRRPACPPPAAARRPRARRSLWPSCSCGWQLFTQWKIVDPFFFGQPTRDRAADARLGRGRHGVRHAVVADLGDHEGGPARLLLRGRRPGSCSASCSGRCASSPTSSARSSRSSTRSPGSCSARSSWSGSDFGTTSKVAARRRPRVLRRVLQRVPGRPRGRPRPRRERPHPRRITVAGRAPRRPPLRAHLDHRQPARGLRVRDHRCHRRGVPRARRRDWAWSSPRRRTTSTPTGSSRRCSSSPSWPSPRNPSSRLLERRLLAWRPPSRAEVGRRLTSAHPRSPTSDRRAVVTARSQGERRRRSRSASAVTDPTRRLTRKVHRHVSTDPVIGHHAGALALTAGLTGCGSTANGQRRRRPRRAAAPPCRRSS